MEIFLLFWKNLVIIFLKTFLKQLKIIKDHKIKIFYESRSKIKNFISIESRHKLI